MRLPLLQWLGLLRLSLLRRLLFRDTLLLLLLVLY